MNFYEAIRATFSLPLPPAAKVVAVYLLDKQGVNQSCWPAITTICRECNLSRDAVLKSLARLEKEGIVKVKRETKPACGKSNHYAIDLTSLENRPVRKTDRSEKRTPTSLENRPVPVRKTDPNNSVTAQDNNPKAETTEGKHRPKAKPVGSPHTEDPKPMFEQARKLYPGTKRGLDAEFGNFTRKHKNWREALPLLAPAIRAEIEHKEMLRETGKFCPEWKNFQTWINGSCWTQEFPEIQSQIDQAIGKKRVTLEDVERLEREVGLTA